MLPGLGGRLASRAAAAAPSYNTQLVARGKLTLSVTAKGTLQPTRTTNIGSERSGTVLKVLVDVNDVIKRGQVLVVLDAAKLPDQIQRSPAAAVAAQARLAQAQATQAEVRAALSTDQINLSKASIVAPSDGVVLARSVDPGSVVAASLQAVTLFTVAENLSKRRLWVDGDEADVSPVLVDQSASFTVAAYLSRVFPTRITRVGQGSTITDNVVPYLTYLDVDNTDLSLRPGMTATATLTAQERQDVMLVPNTALRFTLTATTSVAKKGITAGLLTGPPRNARRPAAAGASTASARQVWVLPEGSSTLQAVAGTPGISDSHFTEITGGAQQLGMKVITDQKSTAAK